MLCHFNINITLAKASEISFLGEKLKIEHIIIYTRQLVNSGVVTSQSIMMLQVSHCDVAGSSL